MALLASVGLVGSGAVAEVPRVEPVVYATYPHDRQAFTQGLLYFDQRLFESTGLRGSSTLRRVELETGTVEQRLALDNSEFGEGLARVDDRLIQLTWTSGRAHVYSAQTFEQLGGFTYSGEGWGLCLDESSAAPRLVMSDGSSQLFFRDPETFELQGSVVVQRDGRDVAQLNELECVHGAVYANIWQTDEIVKIDAPSGQVQATIVVDGLLSPAQAQNADVLNGIAYNAEARRFYITGKLWPALFEVEFPGPAAPDGESTPAIDGGVGSSGSDAGSVPSEAAQASAPEPSSSQHSGEFEPSSMPQARGCQCSLGANPMDGKASTLALLVGLGLLWRAQRPKRCS